MKTARKRVFVCEDESVGGGIPLQNREILRILNRWIDVEYIHPENLYENVFFDYWVDDWLIVSSSLVGRAKTLIHEGVCRLSVKRMLNGSLGWERFVPAILRSFIPDDCTKVITLQLSPYVDKGRLEFDSPFVYEELLDENGECIHERKYTTPARENGLDLEVFHLHDDKGSLLSSVSCDHGACSTLRVENQIFDYDRQGRIAMIRLTRFMTDKDCLSGIRKIEESFVRHHWKKGGRICHTIDSNGCRQLISYRPDGLPKHLIDLGADSEEGRLELEYFWKRDRDGNFISRKVVSRPHGRKGEATVSHTHYGRDGRILRESGSNEDIQYTDDAEGNWVLRVTRKDDGNIEDVLVRSFQYGKGGPFINTSSEVIHN